MVDVIIGDNIDIVRLIQEVRKSPCIWNTNDESHSDKEEKHRTWRSLCEILFDDYHNESETVKEECVHLLQTKWRSLRDAFTKDYKKRLLAKNPTRRPYKYHKQLQFLMALTEKTSDKDDYQEEEDTDDPLQPNICKKAFITRRLSNSEDGIPIKKLPTTFSDILYQDPTDGELHFLLSLYNPLKSIDASLKLQAKIDILNVIKKYQRPIITLNFPGSLNNTL